LQQEAKKEKQGLLPNTQKTGASHKVRHLFNLLYHLQKKNEKTP